MAAVSLHRLRQLKSEQTRFACLTCYDATFARAMAQAEIDVILIGDSLGMVVQGHDSTLPVSIEDMAYHTAAVARGNHHALLMADMPFMSYATVTDALANAAVLMRAGAHLVKLEGEAWLAETVTQLARGGIPACVHMGLTPQAVNVLGGYRVQGRQSDAAERMVEAALRLQDAGAAMLLLECVPRELARRIHDAVDIPLIGIGAGPDCDGQVLVLHDMLGLHHGKPARFVKNFLAAGDGSIESAFRQFRTEVLSGAYPQPAHGFD